MSRNYLGDYDLIVASANNKETALNTEQTMDTSFLVAKEDVVNLDPRREDNSDELTGKEEPDTVYDLGALANASLNFNKAQAQHFGFLLSYALGSVSTSAWGTGYKHVLTPLSDLTVPSFTLGFRGGSVIVKRRFASHVVNNIEVVFEKDSWARIVGGIPGTGKVTSNMFKETVSAAYNATSLTLAANAVEGATAQARLDSVHFVRCVEPTDSSWQDVTVTAVSAATPAVLTITAPGGTADMINYEILYVPTEPAWATFPARVVEPPIRVQDLVLKYGGKWNGTSYLNGHQIDVEIESVTWRLTNQYLIEFRVGGGGDFANYVLRQGRQQTLVLNRQARDYILQQRIEDNENFSVYMKATGEEFESGKNYYAEILLPQCNVLRSPYSISGKVLAEAGDLIVMEDDTYGSVRCEIANKVATYAA